MDYKRVLRLHFVNHLSCREIAESCGDCSKTTVNEFLKRFRENPCIFLCGSTAVPEERKPPVRWKETVKPEQGYRT